MSATKSRTEKRLTTRRMTMAGVYGAICVVLAVTGLGMIPVPNLAGYATIMHVPVIIAAVLEGPLVGAFAGLVMGIYSFITPGSVPPDPIMCILPRILIGVVSGYVYIALSRVNQSFGAAMAGIIGTATNTLGYVGIGILLGYFPSAIWIAIAPQALVELVLAAVLTVIISRTVMRAMPNYRK